MEKIYTVCRMETSVSEGLFGIQIESMKLHEINDSHDHNTALKMVAGLLEKYSEQRFTILTEYKLIK